MRDGDYRLAVVVNDVQVRIVVDRLMLDDSRIDKRWLLGKHLLLVHDDSIRRSGPSLDLLLLNVPHGLRVHGLGMKSLLFLRLFSLHL